jgi:hypothetical protein
MTARGRPHLELLERLAELSVRYPRISWYGFGSFFSSDCSFNDIDLLAVCTCDSEPSVLRSALDDLLVAWPIHLTIMTVEEEAETKFVTLQRCQRLPGPELGESKM